MQRTNHSRKTMENEIVEFSHENFHFMITRFKRINWNRYRGVAQYQYFLFVFDKRLEMVNKEVRDNVFATFEDLKRNINAILSEFILVEDVICECLNLVENLNPIYLNKDEE